ncbi:protein GlmU [Desulfospira joergensenii]|uniref:protein GlmU n=1 Tax=Desulfospira joergensenii TaxID=53329 RepID=UPI0003B58BEA|nr:protein GlmU [Desulfospira joergensenii]
MKERKIEALLQRGVNIPNPDSVYIAEEVDLDRISTDNVTLFSGTKLMGSRTLIMENSRIGYEAPVTLEDTLVGKNTRLNGGFFQGAVFAGENTFGSGAHVRSGTILEEQANAAHTVGLKQTLLFPFVTLGSLINFCDCFMAGGTSRKDHSEVGSSFIHFNYTPNQDKATPSMMGNVHQGVMLDQRPIFLGGQGGIVGPVRIGFGCISAAGSVVRKDEEKPDRLILAGGMKSMSMPWKPGVYSQVERIFNHNLRYIAGLISLKAWYAHVRPLFAGDDLSKALVWGMQENLDICLGERIRRLGIFCEKLITSKEILTSGSKKTKPNGVSTRINSHDRAIQNFTLAKRIFEAELKKEQMNEGGEKVIRAVEAGIREKGKDYTGVIKGLSSQARKTGSEWLYNIENRILEPLLI